jgi:protein dithiol oxidoreductase (disulfide-forming)
MFKKSKFWLACLLAVPMMACAQIDAPYKEGEHYTVLAKPVATVDVNKIEVVELFWYGCPHCYSLEPLVDRWAAQRPNDVEFIRMPAVLNSNWETHARAYFAAQELGVLEKTHGALFYALHVQRKPLFTQEMLAGFYADYGVGEEAFNKVFKSFVVSAQISRVKKAQRGYRLTGVPVVVVNGKYKVDGTMKAGSKGLFDVVDYLIEKERAAK